MYLVRPLAAMGVLNYETRETTLKGSRHSFALSRIFANFVVQKESAAQRR
jgi:hypothetical protein